MEIPCVITVAHQKGVSRYFVYDAKLRGKAIAILNRKRGQGVHRLITPMDVYY